MQNSIANSIAINSIFRGAPFKDLQSGYWRGNRIPSPYGDDCTYLKDFKNKGDVRALQEGIGLTSDSVNLPYVIGDISGISADWEYSFDYRHFDNATGALGLFSLVDNAGRRYDIYPISSGFRVFRPEDATTSKFLLTSGLTLVDGEKYSINVKFNGVGVDPTLTVNGSLVSLVGGSPVGTSGISNKFQMHALGGSAGAGTGGDYFINNVNVYDGSGILIHSWAVNEGDGTTIYDRFGSANGVLTNAVTAIAWGIQDNRFVNYNNTLGYTDSSGTYIPAEIDVDGNPTGLDVLGASLEYIGNAPKHAKLKNSFMLTADGVNDQIYIPGLNDTTIISSEGTSTPSITGETVELTAGTIWNLVLSNGSVFPMAEGQGDIVYDKNGLLNGQLQNFTLASAWTLQDEFHYNIENGFTQELYQSSAGICYQESSQAYGIWEFDVYKGADANYIQIHFIDDAIANSPDANGYFLHFNNAEALQLYRKGVVLFSTVSSYFDNNAHYKIKVERNETLNQYHTGAIGSFKVYIKGGSFGTSYVAVDVSGGSGTNPVVDTTYTTSNYFVLDMDRGDGFGALKKDGVIAQVHYDPLTNTGFTDETGECEKVYIPVDPTATGEDLTNPAKVVGHNGAETQYQFPLCPELFIPDGLIEEYIKPTELIPSASSKFETDGTAWWGAIRGTNSWDSTNKNLIFTSNSTANDIHGLSKSSGLIAANKKYLVTFRAKSATETSTMNFIGNLVEDGFTVISNPALSSSWQDYAATFTATSGNFYLGYRSPMPIGETVEFDDISVKEIKQGYFFEHVGQTQELLGYGYRNWNVDDLGTRYNICYSNATVNCWRDLIQYIQELTAEQDLTVGIFTKLYTVYQTTTGAYLTSDVGKYYVKEI